jgi:hypothetical protein
MLRTTEDAKQPFLFRITPATSRPSAARRAPTSSSMRPGVAAALPPARRAGEIEAVDLESTNGTYVNGQRVDRAVLREGDKLRVGRWSWW